MPAIYRPKPLTEREVEVLRLIGNCLSNKQIAGALCISIKTVEKHRDNLIKKIRCYDVASQVRYAIEHGYVHVNIKTHHQLSTYPVTTT